MKKSFLLAAFAGILLAGCTSDEQTEVATSRTDNPIVFNSPIVNAQTRAAQPGEQVSQYNTSESFHVYGVWSKSNLETWGAATKYMDTDVRYKEISTDIKQNYWASDETYYWPKVGKLSFAAYSPAECSGRKSYGETGLKIEDFEIEEITDKQYDLMYSERSLNRTSSSQLGSSVIPTYSGVDIQFKHALSSIKFLARTGEDYSNTTIRIKKIEISGTYYKGTFNETVTDGASYTSSPSWNVDNDIITSNYVAFENETGTTINNTAQPVPVQSNDVILLPQTLPDGAQFTITYTIQSQSSNEITQTATKTIKDLTATWVMGKRYTYTIVFTLNQIFFTPEVSAWENQPGGDINI